MRTGERPGRRPSVLLLGLAVTLLGLAMLPLPAAAAEVDVTHCFAGTFTVFHGHKDLTPLSSWQSNGIIRSHHANKIFDNAGTHCEGIQRGGGEKADGFALCKLVDGDGDIAIWGGPYQGRKYSLPFLDGTGKWKGIKGSVAAEQAAVGKPALTGATFHICSKWVGTVEVTK